MPVGSNTRAHVNKRNSTVVFHMSKKALKACLLPKKTHYFIFEHTKTKTVKKQPTCQYLEAYLLLKHLNQMKQLLKKKGRVSKKPSSKSFFRLLKNCGYHNIWLFKEIPFVMQQPTLSYSVFKMFHEVLQKNAQPRLIEKKKNSQQLWCFYSFCFFQLFVTCYHPSNHNSAIGLFTVLALFFSCNYRFYLLLLVYPSLFFFYWHWLKLLLLYLIRSKFNFINYARNCILSIWWVIFYCAWNIH